MNWWAGCCGPRLWNVSEMRIMNCSFSADKKILIPLSQSCQELTRFRPDNSHPPWGPMSARRGPRAWSREHIVSSLRVLPARYPDNIDQTGTHVSRRIHLNKEQFTVLGWRSRLVVVKQWVGVTSTEPLQPLITSLTDRAPTLPNDWRSGTV